MFATIGALGGLATIGQLLLYVRERNMKEKITSPASLSKELLILTRKRAILLIILFLLSIVFSGMGFVQSLRHDIELIKPLRPENIQGTIKQWLSTFGYGFQAVTDADYDFLLKVTADNKIVGIGKTKQYPQYLTMLINLTIPDDIQQSVSQLSLEKQRALRRNLRIEMYKLQPERAELLGTSGKTITLTGLSFEKRLPITNALSEDAFFKPKFLQSKKISP